MNLARSALPDCGAEKLVFYELSSLEYFVKATKNDPKSPIYLHTFFSHPEHILTLNQLLGRALVQLPQENSSKLQDGGLGHQNHRVVMDANSA